MPRIYQRLSGREPDLRAMLLQAGVGQYTAVMSVPYMNMLPNTTDPYAQGVMQIVKGLQRLLNAHGMNLPVDGGLGDGTIKMLQKYSGPFWHDKSWAQLYADVIAGNPWQGEVRNDRGPPTGVIVGLGATEAEMISARDALMQTRLASASYCTPANKPAGCSPLAGIAKPMTAAALESFKQLQTQLNRLLAFHNQPTVAIDGRIGPAFIRGLVFVLDRTAGGFLFPTRTVDAVAANATQLVTTLRNLADITHAPTFVANVPASPPSVPTASGGVVHPPDDQIIASASPGFDMSLSNPLMLAALGVGGLLILRKYSGGGKSSKGRKSKGRSSKRTKATRQIRRR